MVAAKYAENGNQQSHTTSKELTFHLCLSFRMDTLSSERKLKLKIYRIKIRNWDWDWNLKRKLIYMEKGNPDCHIWNFYPMKLRFLPLCLISTWFTENAFETSIRTELGKENLYKRYMKCWFPKLQFCFNFKTLQYKFTNPV